MKTYLNISEFDTIDLDYFSVDLLDDIYNLAKADYADDYTDASYYYDNDEYGDICCAQS